jgi:hypothetical protein
MRVRKPKLRKGKQNIYTVDWWRNGWNYRTTTNCKWEDVQNCRRTAKLLGEKITYELDHVETYEYWA